MIPFTPPRMKSGIRPASESTAEEQSIIVTSSFTSLPDFLQCTPDRTSDKKNLDTPRTFDNESSDGSEDLEVGCERLPMLEDHVEFESIKPSFKIEKKEQNEPQKNPTSIVSRGIKYFKYIYSMCLLVFCVTIVMVALFKEKTILAKNVHSAFAFCFFWFLVCWLAVMEGGQGCLVGLQPVDKTIYKDSHPLAFENTKLAHKNGNMDRFIVGRQFLVVLVFFLINMAASPSLEEGETIFGLSPIPRRIFLDNGLAMMITTIMIGQLASQVNAAVCMLDFINSYFMIFTTYVSLAIEYSGLLHSVYLVQMLFTRLSDKPTDPNTEEGNLVQFIFFWIRVLVSTLILFFALAVTVEALFKGQSGMWEGVPSWLSVIVFFILLCIVGLMDGMQIAAFALKNMSEDEQKTRIVAYKNCQLMFAGKNLQAFLIGRQIFVAALMFIVAKIATISIPDDEDNIFGVPDTVQGFLDTGLLGAVVLTIIGSLAWRIVASTFPLAFMSNPVIYIIIRTCLILEATGVCSASWILARVHKPLMGYQPDEVYLSEAKASLSLPSASQEL